MIRQQIQDVARGVLERELTADELRQVRGMCRPGAACPIHPRINRLAREAAAANSEAAEQQTQS